MVELFLPITNIQFTFDILKPNEKHSLNQNNHILYKLSWLPSIIGVSKVFLLSRLFAFTSLLPKFPSVNKTLPSDSFRYCSSLIGFWFYSF